MQIIQNNLESLGPLIWKKWPLYIKFSGIIIANSSKERLPQKVSGMLVGPDNFGGTYFKIGPMKVSACFLLDHGAIVQMTNLRWYNQCKSPVLHQLGTEETSL